MPILFHPARTQTDRGDKAILIALFALSMMIVLYGITSLEPPPRPTPAITTVEDSDDLSGLCAAINSSLPLCTTSK